MKQLILDLLKSGTTRRLAVLALIPLGVWADKKLGLHLDVEAIGAFAVACIAHITQSAWKEATIKKAELAAVASAAATSADPKAAIAAVLEAAGVK
jgi:hypothetical protein